MLKGEEEEAVHMSEEKEMKEPNLGVHSKL